MDWAKSPELRDQLVLYPTRLDEAIGPDHRVRLLDEILRRLDWCKWEAGYHLRLGQPPIHPRILAGVILTRPCGRNQKGDPIEAARGQGSEVRDVES